LYYLTKMPESDFKSRLETLLLELDEATASMIYGDDLSDEDVFENRYVQVAIPAPKGRLDQWEIVLRFPNDYAAPEQRFECVHGFISGSDKYEDGDEVWTSEIAEIKGNMLTTVSKSLYLLGEAAPAPVEQEVESVEVDTMNPINKMTVAELDSELRRLNVLGRSKATTRTAKQRLLTSARIHDDEMAAEWDEVAVSLDDQVVTQGEIHNPMTAEDVVEALVEVAAFHVEMNELQDELEEVSGIPCHLCGRGFEPDPAQYARWGNSGEAWNPSEWECPDCIELMQRAEFAQMEAAQNEQAAEVEKANEMTETSLEVVMSSWWTPGMLAVRFGTAVDPAGKTPMTYAPLNTIFAFKMGNKVMKMHSFNPQKWMGTAWEATLVWARVE